LITLKNSIKPVPHNFFLGRAVPSHNPVQDVDFQHSPSSSQWFDI
jgi:hypothetical protein